jgi:threonine efflux protein
MIVHSPSLRSKRAISQAPAVWKLESQLPSWVRGLALVIVVINESGWYAAVALPFSSRPAQVAYRRVKRWIDRATGTVMMLFGVRLILSARS